MENMKEKTKKRTIHSHFVDTDTVGFPELTRKESTQNNIFIFTKHEDAEKKSRTLYKGFNISLKGKYEKGKQQADFSLFQSIVEHATKLRTGKNREETAATIFVHSLDQALIAASQRFCNEIGVKFKAVGKEMKSTARKINSHFVDVENVGFPSISKIKSVNTNIFLFTKLQEAKKRSDILYSGMNTSIQSQYSNEKQQADFRLFQAIIEHGTKLRSQKSNADLEITFFVHSNDKALTMACKRVCNEMKINFKSVARNPSKTAKGAWTR